MSVVRFNKRDRTFLGIQGWGIGSRVLWCKQMCIVVNVHVCVFGWSPPNDLKQRSSKNSDTKKWGLADFASRWWMVFASEICCSNLHSLDQNTSAKTLVRKGPCFTKRIKGCVVLMLPVSLVGWFTKHGELGVCCPQLTKNQKITSTTCHLHKTYFYAFKTWTLLDIVEHKIVAKDEDDKGTQHNAWCQSCRFVESHILQGHQFQKAVACCVIVRPLVWIIFVTQVLLLPWRFLSESHTILCTEHIGRLLGNEQTKVCQKTPPAKIKHVQNLLISVFLQLMWCSEPWGSTWGARCC